MLFRSKSGLKALESSDFSLTGGDEALVFDSLEEALEGLYAQAKKGLGVQRYKGLGEMNAEQLWETTMNPDKRTLLRVTIEDATDAALLFEKLMGEEVEPRRAFIERNARYVRNLDV